MPDIDTSTIEQITQEFFRERKKTLAEYAKPYQMEELTKSFKNLRDSFHRLLNSLTEEQVSFSPDATTYSLSEIASHLAAMQGNVYNGLIDLSASTRSHIDPVPRELGGGAEKGVGAPELQNRLKKATDDLLDLIKEAYKPANDENTFEHPLFGILSPKGSMLLQLIHDLDHLKQAQILRRSRGFPRKSKVVSN